MKPLVGNSAHKKAVLAAREANPARLTNSKKQIKARAKRTGGWDSLTEREQAILRGKPMEEWDLQELAKGRPRDKNGNFTGASPKWVTRDMHERSLELFKKAIRTDMQSHTIRALEVISDVMDDESCDDKGKPNVNASTKVDVAKFLIEHLMGKPTQPIQSDISIRLQGVLGASLVMPSELTAIGSSGTPTYRASSSHRDVDESIEDADIVDGED